MLAKDLEHREHPNWFSVKGSELVRNCRVNEPQIKWAWADGSGRYWVHGYRVAEVHQVLQVYHWAPSFKVLLPSKSSQLGIRGYHTCPWGHGTLATATNKSPSLTPTLQIQTLVSLEDVGYLCDTDYKQATSHGFCRWESSGPLLKTQFLRSYCRLLSICLGRLWSLSTWLDLEWTKIYLSAGLQGISRKNWLRKQALFRSRVGRWCSLVWWARLSSLLLRLLWLSFMATRTWLLWPDNMNGSPATLQESSRPSGPDYNCWGKQPGELNVSQHLQNPDSHC